MGDAMISQEADVADSIQRLRAKASAAGNLQSTSQQTVTTQGSGDSIQYVIQPTNPEIVYVPSYSPSWAYGAWPYPAYPPVYYPFAGALARGILWGVGFAAAGAIFGGWNWGGRGNSYVNVNVNRAVNIDNHFNRNNINTDGRWKHDVDHRKGVGYRDNATREEVQPGSMRPDAAQRQEFRGRLENSPGNHPQIANRPDAGNHPQLANRPGAGGGGVQRPNVAQHQNFNRGNAQRPNAIGGVNRGQQINHQAQRGHQQVNRAEVASTAPRGGGGGGEGGGGGGGGGGGARGGGGGGGARGGGGGHGGRR